MTDQQGHEFTYNSNEETIVDKATDIKYTYSNYKIDIIYDPLSNNFPPLDEFEANFGLNIEAKVKNGKEPTSEEIPYWEYATETFAEVNEIDKDNSSSDAVYQENEFNGECRFTNNKKF